MIKSKKQMFIVIGVFTLVLLLGSVTYAFFNYTRTGSPNNFSVGRIYFKSDNEETISLNNLFPIDPSNATEMNDPTKVGTYSIDITGDTDYVDGLEYLVSVVDSDISNLPISIDVSVSNGLGTSNANYFTARESKNASIYKKLMGDTITGDGMLLVGYVKPNTTSGVIEGVDGTITITAYLDKNKILITDTYDGTESDNMGTPNSMAEGKTVISTDDWNSLSANGASFKVKVEANEGIWVNESLEMMMRRNAVMDNIQSTYVSASTGIDFGAASSDTNGKGVYMRAGTENDTNPIVYYRGAVENNNVVFNNKCWKMVRTTDTGGVKLIYNGDYGTVYQDDNYGLDAYTNVSNLNDMFQFDTTTNEWKTLLRIISNGSSPKASLKFNVAEAGTYILKIYHPDVDTYLIKAYRGGTQLQLKSGTNEILLENLDTNETITVSNSIYGFAKDEAEFKVSLSKGKKTVGIGCGGFEDSSMISLNEGGVDKNAFEYSTYTSDIFSSGYMSNNTIKTYEDFTNEAYYDSTYTWDGENYHLSESAVQNYNNFERYYYSCGKEYGKTCPTLRYYNYYYGPYIVLANGDGPNEAFNKAQLNSLNSNVKDKIDSWYGSNMTTVTSKIEDTIYCNDRSMTPNNWRGNFNSYTRIISTSSPIMPILSCINKNDAFTVNNEQGNKKLSYPVGMITADEVVLAGGTYRRNYNFYLNNGGYYWTLTPYDLNEIFSVRLTGGLGNSGAEAPAGIRPVISLKPGQLVRSGTGTVLDPYVIE